MADLAKLVVRLEAETAKYQAGLEKATRKLESFEGAANSAIGKIGQTFNRILAGVTVGALAALAKSAVDSADRLNDLSKISGESVETLSALGYAGKQSGTDLEGLAAGLKKLSKNAVDAAAGGKAQAEAFDALGVSVTTANGAVKGSEQLLLDVAERFAMFEDGAQKAAIAQDLFGKSGTDLIPFLNQGRTGIEELTNKARELGLVVSTEAAAAADQFNDNLATLGAQVQAFTLQAIGPLLPVLNGAIEGFSKSATGAREFGIISSALVTGLKLVVDIGFSVYRTFVNLGNSIGALAAAAVQFARGNFSEAANIFKQANEDQKQAAADANEFLRKLWSDTGKEIVATATDANGKLLKLPLFGGGGKPKAKEGELQEIVPTSRGGQLDRFFADLEERTRTTTENIVRAFDETRASLDQLFAAGRIGAEEYNARIQEALETALPLVESNAKKVVQTVEASLSELDVFQKKLAESSVDIIAGALKNGFKDGIDGVLESFGQLLIDLSAQAVAADLARKLFGEIPGGGGGGGGGGLLGSIIGGIAGIFGGSRDSGGRGSPGRAYAIGTGAQPELFIPDAPGRFFPAGSMGGAGAMTVTNNFTISAPNGSVTRQTEMQIAAAAARGITQAARRNN